MCLYACVCGESVCVSVSVRAKGSRKNQSNSDCYRQVAT